MGLDTLLDPFAPVDDARWKMADEIYCIEVLDEIDSALAPYLCMLYANDLDVSRYLVINGLITSV